jgi:hypothetical protein
LIWMVFADPLLGHILESDEMEDGSQWAQTQKLRF